MPRANSEIYAVAARSIVIGEYFRNVFLRLRDYKTVHRCLFDFWRKSPRTDFDFALRRYICRTRGVVGSVVPIYVQRQQ